jgi:hypothetical protein
MTPELEDRIRGCLLAGAIGDALGAPYEFASWAVISSTLGAAGVTDVLSPGHFTDDTQMTLFTIEALMHSGLQLSATGVCHPPTQLHDSYLRWLTTQGFEAEVVATMLSAGSRIDGGFLVNQPILHRQEAPGRTCLSALESGDAGTASHPINDSKGCGGVMRAAPAGFLTPGVPVGGSAEEAYAAGVECAAITHGHPEGFHAAGLFAAMIHMIMAGASIAEAYESSKHLTTEVLREHVGRAIEVGKLAPPSPEVIDTELGAGWVAEEALAIAVACAVSAPDLERGLLASVNHSGDTDSTGSICGNLLGAAHGVAAIPIGWINALDGADLIEMIADDCVLWVVGEPRSDVPDPDFAHLFGRYVA